MEGTPGSCVRGPLTSSTLEVVLRQVRVLIPQSKDFTKEIQKEKTCYFLLFLGCIYPN